MATLKQARQLLTTAAKIYNEWIDGDMRGDEKPAQAALNEYWIALDVSTLPVHAQRTAKEFHARCRQWAKTGELPASFGWGLREMQTAHAQAPPSIDGWEPPAEMLKQGVPLGAIKSAWRLTDEKLEAELAKPGSIVDDKYRANLERELQRQTGWIDPPLVWRCPGPPFVADEAAEPPAPPRHVPELRQLVADGANFTQIRRFYPDVTTQQIAPLAAELGVQWPPGDGSRFVSQYGSTPEGLSTAADERAVPTRDLYTPAELEAMYGPREAARILADEPLTESSDAAEVAKLHAEGKSVQWIARRLNLSPEQVQGLLRQAARAAAAE
jgi:hypothetical protein